MPSWVIHRKVCEKLLGYYNQEIDRVIDSEISHDSSRYDIESLVKVVRYIKERYGIDGLKQFIMHHYLDRLSDIVVSAKTSGALSPSIIDSDPNNILNLLIYPYEYLEEIARRLYSGKSKRRKRSEVLGRLHRANQRLHQYPELKNLKPLILEVVKLIKDNIKFILDFIYKDERTWKRIEVARRMQQIAPKLSLIYAGIKYEYKEKLRRELNQKNNIGVSLINSTMHDNKEEMREEKLIDFKKILTKRILQLDNLYSVSTDLKTKASILSQMIQLAKEVDREVLKEKYEENYPLTFKDEDHYEISTIIISDIMTQGYSYSIRGKEEIWLDYLRAKLLSHLARKGLIDDFPEIDSHSIRNVLSGQQINNQDD